MKRPRSRLRRIVVTDDLLAAFKAALAFEMVGARKMSKEKSAEGLAAIQAFNLAAGVRPWERSPLDPVGDHPLQAPLLAKLSESEMKAWERYARKCRKEHAAFVAEYEAASRRAAERVKSSLAQ
jgi:hypothetical protein